MATTIVPQNKPFVFRFANPMQDGKISIQFNSYDDRLEIDLPCTDHKTVNRLYIEKTESGFDVCSHNHNSPQHPEEEREINCEF